MYLVKFYKGKELLDVAHYEKFENIVADVSDLTIFADKNVPEELLESCTKPPKLYYAGESEDGVADDFEFRFKNDVYIYAGRIFTEEEKERMIRNSQNKKQLSVYIDSLSNNELVELIAAMIVERIKNGGN